MAPEATDKKAHEACNIHGLQPKLLDRANSSTCMDVAMKLFEVMDLDCSGAIQFREFLELHYSMIRFMAQLPVLTRETLQDKLQWHSQKAMEEEFRAVDVDHNMILDPQEWSDYMEHLYCVFGKRIYHQVCRSVLKEQDEKRQEAFEKQSEMLDSLVASENLLAKAIRLPYMSSMHAREALTMLEKQADPNFATPESKGSVLYHVASKCEPSFMAALINAGGNPSLNFDDWNCPVFAAAQARRLENVRLLVVQECSMDVAEHPESNHSLTLIREMADMTEKNLRELVQKGADINYKTPQGWTAIQAAVFWGKKDCLDCMIRLKETFSNLRLHVDITNAKNRTALHVAAKKGKPEMMPTLLGARADTEKRDMDGWTPLHYAAFNSQEEAVVCLVSAGANVRVRDSLGFTPWMLQTCPDAVKPRLQGEAHDMIKPPAQISFAAHILPALQDPDTTPFEKLETILSLETVAGKPENLRMTDLFFHPVKGPNKIQLKKMWDLLAKEMLKRLGTGMADIDSRCFDDCSEEATRRRDVQARFVEQWLSETNGPVQSKEWSFENRGGYEEDFNSVVQEEIEQFKMKFDNAYKALEADESCADLFQLPAENIILQQYMSQQGAHEILTWIDTLDMAEAWRALISVKAFGEQAVEDDKLAILRFMDLVTMEPHFATPQSFWTNVYSLWLASYAKMVDGPFQNKLRSSVNHFNESYEKEGYQATFVPMKPRTDSEIQASAEQLGTAGYETFEERTVASKVLDIVQSCIVVNSPQAAVALVEHFSNMMLHHSKLELVLHEASFIQTLPLCRHRDIARSF
eukprot:gnl/MRDRNA2_/MRDRNA2_74768_c0_seq1.p1 gnl/MRDRNA2_/MRDRNA2_74768_c0~~gnl/MRDRNA2_/MRDRNA2_74768_c0_seq1.p1  ORF type:complete len:808 (-),score=171.10 gnl/MRDRNA2_/MRDRNA2_74768_c0_seq1:292-2715(-)